MPSSDLSELDLRVLSHYGAGTELRSIAAMLKVDVEDVREVVATHTGFVRNKAGDIVRRAAGKAPLRAPAAVLDREPAPRLTKSNPVPAPEVAPAAAPEPDPEPAAPAPTGHSSVDALLAWADEAGGRFGRKAERIRAVAAELGRDLEANEQVLAAVRRVAELRRELDMASEELRGLRAAPAPDGRPAVSAREVKAWAAKAGVECSEHGRPAQGVFEAYYAAHPEVSHG